MYTDIISVYVYICMYVCVVVHTHMQWWAIRGSRAFSAGPIKNVLVKHFFIDYFGIILICVMSTNCL